MRKKVRITTVSNDHDVRYDTKAIIHDNSIVYIEKDGKNTKTYFNYDKNQLIRENKEMSMQYTFNKEKQTIGKLLVYDLQRSIELKIITKDIVRCGENIEIKFEVEKEPIEYKIEVIK